jgi:hypothetical protein
VATKFRPGGFHPLHPVPAHTLTDQVIDSPFAPFARAGDEREQVALLEQGLRVHGFEDDPRVTEIGALYEAMLAAQVTTVEELCRHAGSSGSSASTWA